MHSIDEVSAAAVAHAALTCCCAMFCSRGQALEKVELIARHVNDCKRAVEAMSKLLEVQVSHRPRSLSAASSPSLSLPPVFTLFGVQNRLSGDFQGGLLQPHRRVIRERLRAPLAPRTGSLLSRAPQARVWPASCWRRRDFSVAGVCGRSSLMRAGRHSGAEWLSSGARLHDRVIFLFSDIIMWTSPTYRYKGARSALPCPCHLARAHALARSLRAQRRLSGGRLRPVAGTCIPPAGLRRGAHLLRLQGCGLERAGVAHTLRAVREERAMTEGAADVNERDEWLKNLLQAIRQRKKELEVTPARQPAHLHAARMCIDELGRTAHGATQCHGDGSRQERL
jgi:hypothetical protein